LSLPIPERRLPGTFDDDLAKGEPRRLTAALRARLRCGSKSGAELIRSR
jgi:hypothetical protein